MTTGRTQRVPRWSSGTDRPLASLYDVALLDLDGVVYVGPLAVPHAAEALDGAAAQYGMRAAFVTNNASRPPSVVAEHLRELGVQASDADVVTSAQAGARVLAEMVPSGSRVLAIGGPGVAAALDERGLRAVFSADDDPVAVIQGYGPDVGWRELAEGSLVIGRGLPWVATNLDRTIPTPRGRVIGNGSLVAALRHATGVDPVVAGKPEPPLMLESVERTRAERPLVVGDRLDTDIEGAVRSGIASLLVLTGVTAWTDLLAAPPEHRPDHLSHDLRGLLRPQPRVRVELTPNICWASCGAWQAQVPVGPRPPDSGRAPDRGARIADARVPESESEPGDDPREWLPPGLEVGHLEPDADLDGMRALIGAAWAIADAGRSVRSAASLRPVHAGD